MWIFLSYFLIRFINTLPNDWTGVATGILFPHPFNEIYTLGDSVYYLFDENGNRIGTKDISGLREISENQIEILNKEQILIGFEKAQKQIAFNKDENTNIGFNKN